MKWQKKGISWNLLTWTDIKSGALILNETPQMQFFGDTIIGAIEKGQVAEWINSVLTSFNKMNKANQLEFMTLCNIYDFQESPLCKKRIIIEMIVGKDYYIDGQNIRFCHFQLGRISNSNNATQNHSIFVKI